MLLEISGLRKEFGGLVAIDDFSMEVREGEVVGLIGPNGAGKSTLFNLVTGVLRPTKGSILFKGRSLVNKKPHQVAAMGIGRTFQFNPMFGDFTVMQNVVTSVHVQPKSSFLDIYFNTPRYRRNEQYISQRASEILRLLGLYHVRDELARNLPHGLQRLLGVARALASNPTLLLLDEPLSGMNPIEIELALDCLRRVHQSGVSLVIVEHNMQVLEVCNRVVVMCFGRKIFDGVPAEVRQNPQVVSVYFGEGDDA